MDVFDECIYIKQTWVSVGLITMAGVVAGGTALLMCLDPDNKQKNRKTKEENSGCFYSSSESSVSEYYNDSPSSCAQGYDSHITQNRDTSPSSPAPSNKPSPRRRIRYSSGDVDQQWQVDHQLPHEEEMPPDDFSNRAFNNSSTCAEKKTVIKKCDKECLIVEPTRSNIKEIDSATAIAILKALNMDEEPDKETMDAFYTWLGLSSARKMITCEEADVGFNVFTAWHRELCAGNSSTDYNPPNCLHRCSFAFQKMLYSDKQRKQKENSSAGTVKLKYVVKAKSRNKTDGAKCRYNMEGATCRTNMEDINGNTNKEGAKYQTNKVLEVECRTNLEGWPNQSFNMESAKSVNTDVRKSTKVEVTKLPNMEGLQYRTSMEGERCRMPYTVDTNPRRILRIYKKARSEHRMNK